MLKRASYAWTPDDEAKLRELADKGTYLRNIALKLRRSESSIKKRARDLKIKVQITPRSRFRFDGTTKTSGQTNGLQSAASATTSGRAQT